MHDKESWQNIVPININTQTRSRAHFQAAQNTHDFMDNCTDNMANSVAKLEFSRSVAVCIDPLNHQCNTALPCQESSERCFFKEICSNNKYCHGRRYACGCIQMMPHYKMVWIGHGPDNGVDGGPSSCAGWNHKSKIA